MSENQLIATYFVLNLAANMASGFAMKSWAVTNAPLMLAANGIIAIIGTTLMALQVRMVGLSAVGTYLLIATVITNVLIGVVMFGEKLSVLQTAGTILALCSVGLILFGARA